MNVDQAHAMLRALRGNFGKTRGREAAFGEMPGEIAEVREARLRKCFVNGKVGCAKFCFQLELIDVELAARHDLEAHCANYSKIGTRPFRKRRSEL